MWIPLNLRVRACKRVLSKNKKISKKKYSNKQQSIPTIYFKYLFVSNPLTWELGRHYRLHNHKLYRPEGKIHLKYLETTIGYPIINFCL